MEFLRKIEGNAIEWIEYAVVEQVQVQLEAMTPEEWIQHFNLGPIFQKMLGDKRFTE